MSGLSNGAAVTLAALSHLPREVVCTVCKVRFTARGSQSLYCKPCAYKVRYGRRKAKREAKAAAAPKAG